MPRLIKASLDPGKLRSTAEASRGGYKRPAEKDAAKVASEVIGLTGAVMKHPVTDLIVRGVNELVLLGKDNTPGYEGLLEQRRERLKQKAARRKAGPAPVAPVGPYKSPYSGVAPKTPILEVPLEAGKEAARMLQKVEPSVAPQVAPPVAPSGKVKTLDAESKEGPKIDVPRSVEEIVGFVSSPMATPEDLDWAMKQMAKFAPVLSLDDLGRPKTKYSATVLEAYAKATKRTPTELDLAKLGYKERSANVKEAKLRDARLQRKEDIARYPADQAQKDKRAAAKRAERLRLSRGKGQDKAFQAKSAISEEFAIYKQVQELLKGGVENIDEASLSELVDRIQNNKPGMVVATTTHGKTSTINKQFLNFYKKTAKEQGAEGLNYQQLLSFLARWKQQTKSAIKKRNRVENQLRSDARSDETKLELAQKSADIAKGVLSKAQQALASQISTTKGGDKIIKQSDSGEYVLRGRKEPVGQLATALKTYQAAYKASTNAKISLKAAKDLYGGK